MSGNFSQEFYLTFTSLSFVVCGSSAKVKKDYFQANKTIFKNLGQTYYISLKPQSKSVYGR